MERLKILLLALVSTAIFLGLAILGEGGVQPFFAVHQMTWMVGVTGTLLVASLFSSGNLDPGIVEDRSNRWVFIGFTLVAVLLAWLPAYDDRHELWTFDGDFVRWCGLALYTAGGVVRLLPVFVLGRQFSGLVAIQRDHQLVTDGLYGHIRHPSYLGMLMTVFGWALLFRSGLGLVVAALNFIPIIGRIRAEEAMLQSQFGEQYAAYRARTWRLLPHVY